MNKSIRIALVTALFCALGLVCYAIAKMNEERRHQVTCAGVKVEFADDFNFVTAEDIEGYLKKEYGAYIGQRLDSLDLVKVEKILDGKGAILKTEAYTTPDGLLNVKVFQREPLVRFQKGNTGFYADEKGFIFPLQNNYTSRVPIVDGAVPLNVASGYKGEAKTPQEKQWLSRIIAMVTFMEASKVWAEDISQITVKPGGDLVMVPREGKEVFIFGQPTDVAAKFEKIGRYYTAIVPDKGEGYYSTVNVKFKDQIVCRK